MGTCTYVKFEVRIHVVLTVLELVAFNAKAGLIDPSPAHNHPMKTASPPFTSLTWRI